MAGYGERARMQIGEVLKSSRTRQGIDIGTVEERTKIRTKYLRALENEDWEVLPSPAYAKGFLRTYAQLLGLDGDALVDEYRRQMEARRQPAYAVREPVLAHPRRTGEPSRGPGRGAVIGIVAAAAVAFLLVLGLTGGDDGDRERAERRQARQERQERQERRREARRREREGAQRQVTLRLVMETAVHVCLVGDGDRPLIDGQVLPAGTEERFEAERFLLGFPSGYDVDQFRLFLDGERERLPEMVGPAAFRIRAPDRVRPAPSPGPGCP